MYIFIRAVPSIYTDKTAYVSKVCIFHLDGAYNSIVESEACAQLS